MVNFMSFESEKDYIVIDDNINHERWIFDNPKSSKEGVKDIPEGFTPLYPSGINFDVQELKEVDDKYCIVKIGGKENGAEK